MVVRLNFLYRFKCEVDRKYIFFQKGINLKCKKIKFIYVEKVDQFFEIVENFFSMKKENLKK